VTSKESIEDLVKEISKRENHIDLLLNAAGISGPKASPKHDDASKLKETLWNNEDFDGWKAVFETNVASVYFVTIAFLPLLQHHHSRYKPSVVCIGSMSGLTKDSQNHFAYNSSKGAAHQLVQLMAAEFVDTGVRVNGISPGYFPSEMTSKEDSDARQKSHLGEGYVQGKDVPAGRVGAEEDMGGTILYLASRAGEYLNGHVVVLDGGWLLKH
jgi:NAD(P)-dependent dehydrogenase (short-subunit alcohol dehydrogenase family)